MYMDYSDYYEEFIEQVAISQGLKKEKPLIKKGQGLIWAANLLHGGEPINRPDESLTSTTVSSLPVKWTANCLYSQANANNTWALTLSGAYYQQAANKRYQFGFEATHNDYSNVSVGLYYGGSFKKVTSIRLPSPCR